MRLTLVALLLCLGCSSTPTTYNQSAFRPPPRPPVFVPSQDAPHTFQPGQPVRKPDVPPQPRPKRYLPPEPDGKPGIWASDLPNDLPLVPVIDGFVVPFPDGATTEEDKFLARECAMMVNGTKGVWDPLDLRTGWTMAQRKCLAATLFHACIHRIDEVNALRRANGELFRDVERWLPPSKSSADAFLASACSGVIMPPKYVGMIGASNKPLGVLLMGQAQRVFK